jgi:hypothetical protein
MKEDNHQQEWLKLFHLLEFDEGNGMEDLWFVLIIEIMCVGVVCVAKSS